MDKKFISELKEKEQVSSFFMLKKKDLKLTKYDKPYLGITLVDRTGKIEGRIWDNAEQFNKTADTGDVILVKGIVDKYREDKQIKVDFIAKADDKDFQYEDMVRVVDNRDEIYEKVLLSLQNIENKWIRSLADAFVRDDDIMEAFRTVPGGKSWHNAYIGGLLEHTLEVMFIAGAMCELYSEIDRDVVVFGSFIHDIGKVYELDAKKMEYTVEGGLVGHIAIGHKLLTKKIESIPDFPDQLSLRLEHIILSHHGEYEQQSPVLPKTLEATVIYQSDELVSQANAVKEIQLSQAEGGREWSNFVSIKNRKYYITDVREEKWHVAAEDENHPEKKVGKGKGKDDSEDLFP